MDYDYVEKLAAAAKQGDEVSKEALASEFTPLILRLSNKAYINSYEIADIRNECYKTLFKCVLLYNKDKHRFVAYATNAIKNSVNYLIRVSVRRSSAEGKEALILDNKLEQLLHTDLDNIEDKLVAKGNKMKLKSALKSLSFSEQELVNYVYFRDNSLKSYAELKGISYSAAVTSRNNVLKKLQGSFKQPRGKYSN